MAREMLIAAAAEWKVAASEARPPTAS